MDCLRASEIVSAAHDGDLVEAGVLAEARAHCAGCAECRAFTATLERLESVPAPRAPDDLVTRLVAIGIAPAPGPAAPIAESPAVVTAKRFRWAPRATSTTFISVAAVLLVALTAGGIALLSANRGPEAALDASAPTAADTGDTMAESQEGAGVSDDTTPMRAGEQAGAPAYVVLDGGVWQLIETVGPGPSEPATAGVVSTSLGSTGAAEQRLSYFAGGDASTLYVVASDGAYMVFERVVRSLGRAEYGLTSDSAITHFGQWPQLPARFAQPQNADGSPTFRRFGFDDLNVDVYVPTAGRIQDGFAVAPDTGPGDPAAGNPGWTWWERLR